MPSKPLKPCAHPMCGVLVRARFCDAHQSRHYAKADERRGSRHQRGYGTAWDKLRKRILMRDPMCVHCHRAASTDVDHIKPKVLGGGDDPSNLQGLCRLCHATKTAAEHRGGESVNVLPFIATKPAHPVVVLCGPPGAGKSTRVREKYSGWDLIDISRIKARLSGRPIYADADQFVWPAIAERNRLLESISRPTVLETLAPQISYRRHWREQLNATVEVIETPAHECLRRIENDQARAAQPMTFWSRLVSLWWGAYVTDPLDTVGIASQNNAKTT